MIRLLWWKNLLASPFTGYRFLSRIQPAQDQPARARVRLTISLARLFLAVVCLSIAVLRPLEPTGFATLTYALLMAYVVHSLSIVAVLGRPIAQKNWFDVSLHFIDMLVVSSYFVITQGMTNCFFTLFIFITMTAAHMWGSREAIVTAPCVYGLIFLEDFISGSHFRKILMQQQNFLDAPTYLVAISIAAGFITEEIKKLTAANSVIARILGRIHPDTKFKQTLRSVFDDALQIFGAREILLAVQDAGSGSLYLWQASRSPDTECSLQLSELEPDQKETYFFAAPPLSWSCSPGIARHTSKMLCLSLQDSSGHVRKECWDLPVNFRKLHPFKCLLVDSTKTSQGYSIRVFLPDPVRELCGAAGLLFLHMLFPRAGSALSDVYHSRRLLAMAEEAERSSLAGELHDGLVQSLVSIELRSEVLRRGALSGNPEANRQVEEIQALLRGEIVNLRRLMWRLKTPKFSPRACVQALNSLAAHFQSELGITVRFETSVKECKLSPQGCGEVVRILQEALVNSSKHSRADAIRVRLDKCDGDYVLEIRDNGVGFDFEGCYSFSQLEARGMGPAVLKDRVRRINADLVIKSTPGKGATLKITIPGI